MASIRALSKFTGSCCRGSNWHRTPVKSSSVSVRRGTVRTEGGALVFSMYGLQPTSYGKELVTWGNSLGTAGRKGRERNKERDWEDTQEDFSLPHVQEAAQSLQPTGSHYKEKGNNRFGVSAMLCCN
ncbi:hypothetical protein Q8A73_015208 [Channa argus]|nr:hypothetical protein Q8A73_015208 [Channa argus]